MQEGMRRFNVLNKAYNLFFSCKQFDIKIFSSIRTQVGKVEPPPHTHTTKTVVYNLNLIISIINAIVVR